MNEQNWRWMEFEQDSSQSSCHVSFWSKTTIRKSHMLSLQFVLVCCLLNKKRIPVPAPLEITDTISLGRSLILSTPATRHPSRLATQLSGWQREPIFAINHRGENLTEGQLPSQQIRFLNEEKNRWFRIKKNLKSVSSSLFLQIPFSAFT